ncbi:30S ribosomal protein S20 [candidate division KSB1 bacterium]|nr:30S ribosomal protein S20 [candidate division KSB1 bacterium]
MAHHKSAIKRIKTNARNTERNKAHKSLLKTQIKKVRAANNREQGEMNYRETTSLLDSLAQKGVIHKNKAANQKAKLAALVNKLEK